MTFGENLNEWFRVMGRQWKPLLIASIVAFVPVAIGVVLAFWAFEAAESFDVLLDPELLDTLSDDQVFDLLSPFLATTAVWVALQVIATVYVYVVTGRVIALDRNEQTISTAGVTRFATSRLVPGSIAMVLVVFLVIAGLAVAAGLGWLFIDSLGADFVGVFLTAVVGLTAIVIVTWISLSVSLFPDVLAMEEAGASEALSRSFKLVRGRWWPTLGFILVTGLIASVVAQALSIVLVPIFFFGAAAPAFFGIAYGLTALLQAPVTAAVGAAYAVWYVSLRSSEGELPADQLLV